MFRYQWYVMINPYRRPCPLRGAKGLVVPRARFDVPGLRAGPPSVWTRLRVWAQFAPREGRLCWHTVYP